MLERDKILNLFLSDNFRPFLRLGYPIDMNGKRCTTTDRGPVNVAMHDSRTYDALYAYLYENGEKPELKGDAAVVGKILEDFTSDIVQWKMLPIDYEKMTDEDGNIYLDITIIRWE